MLLVKEEPPEIVCREGMSDFLFDTYNQV